MEELRARCVPFGKKAKDSLDVDLRAIVPMSSILRLLDRALAMKLDACLLTLLPSTPGFLIGGRPHTQCLDIAHGAALFIEKALDCRSEGSVAQADIRCYFDSLPLLLIFRWLLQHKVDPRLIAAIGRHQLLTTVYVCLGQCSAKIAARSCGGLTGSQLALLLGRIPVESSFADLSMEMDALCFRTDTAFLKAASYIDNLYTVSKSMSGATGQMELILCYLQKRWGLHAKPDSKCVLTAKGADEDTCVGHHWHEEDASMVLGWFVQSDGGTRLNWERMQHKIWRAYFANVRAPGWRKLGMRRRLALVDRSVAGVVQHAVSIMPPSHTYCCKLDSVQRRMVSGAMGNYRLPIETWDQFFKRSARESARWIEANSRWWSRNWLKHTVNWYAHLERDWIQQKKFWEHHVQPELLSTQWSWAAVLYSFHDADWLAKQRTYQRRHGQTENLCSRTGTRAHVGRVHIRSHEGLAYAQRMGQ